MGKTWRGGGILGDAVHGEKKKKRTREEEGRKKEEESKEEEKWFERGTTARTFPQIGQFGSGWQLGSECGAWECVLVVNIGRCVALGWKHAGPVWSPCGCTCICVVLGVRGCGLGVFGVTVAYSGEPVAFDLLGCSLGFDLVWC